MKPKIGFALSGSFCTFDKSLDALENLAQTYDIVPILSDASFTIDSRFGTAESFRKRIEEICGTKILHTIADVEPLGPKKLLDLLVIAPCTGNTIGKLANQLKSEGKKVLLDLKGLLNKTEYIDAGYLYWRL